MSNINTILLCLSSVLSNIDRRHLQLISYALLAMNGRVTMLGLSCWTEKAGRRDFEEDHLNTYIPTQYLKNSEVTAHVLTDIYQMTVRPKRLAPLLKVVVIRKTNRQTEKVAQVILFSTEKTL